MNQRKTVALLNDNESNIQTYKIVEFEKNHELFGCYVKTFASFNDIFRNAEVLHRQKIRHT